MNGQKEQMTNRKEVSWAVLFELPGKQTRTNLETGRSFASLDPLPSLYISLVLSYFTFSALHSSHTLRTFVFVLWIPLSLSLFTLLLVSALFVCLRFHLYIFQLELLDKSPLLVCLARVGLESVECVNNFSLLV